MNRPVPTAKDLIRFNITGPGKILGVGNGDPSSHEPDVFIEKDSRWHRKLFNGLAQVIIRADGAPGDLVLTATAAGLAPAKIIMQIR
jgi:beta-galactosidase